MIPTRHTSAAPEGLWNLAGGNAPGAHPERGMHPGRGAGSGGTSRLSRTPAGVHRGAVRFPGALPSAKFPCPSGARLQPIPSLTSLSLAPGFSRVMAGETSGNRFNGFCGRASWTGKPLKRFASRADDDTRLKPGANETLPT